MMIGCIKWLPSITMQEIPTIKRSLTILIASFPPSSNIVTIGKPSPLYSIKNMLN